MDKLLLILLALVLVFCIGYVIGVTATIYADDTHKRIEASKHERNDCD